MVQDSILAEIASSKLTLFVWHMLALVTVTILILSLVALHTGRMRSCKLGCLLILRCICLADVCFVVHRAVFFMLNLTVPVVQSRILTTWTCKLYHALETLLMNLQSWLLVLLALERAALRLNPMSGLTNFSRLRLKIGLAISGVLAFSVHINYIYVFAPVLRPVMAGANQSVVGGGGGFGDQPIRVTRDGVDNGTGIGTAASASAGEYVDGSNFIEVCSVDFGFETFYNYAKVAELFIGVYLPVLLANGCAAFVAVSRVAHGHLNLCGHTTSSNLVRTSCGLPGSPRLAYIGSSAATAIATTNRVNAAVETAFLVMVFCCFLPLEAMGVYRAVAVHRGTHALSILLYDLVNNLLLPVKNFLDSVVIGCTMAQLVGLCRSCGRGNVSLNNNGFQCRELTDRVVDGRGSTEARAEVELEALNPRILVGSCATIE